MASSVREMEAFLQATEKPVPSAAPAQPQGKRRGRPKGSKTNPEKLARQAAKRERAKSSRGGAAKPSPAPETPPIPPSAFRPRPPPPPPPHPLHRIRTFSIQHSAFSIPPAAPRRPRPRTSRRSARRTSTRFRRRTS